MFSIASYSLAGRRLAVAATTHVSPNRARSHAPGKSLHRCWGTIQSRGYYKYKREPEPPATENFVMPHKTIVDNIHKFSKLRCGLEYIPDVLKNGTDIQKRKIKKSLVKHFIANSRNKNGYKLVQYCMENFNEEEKIALTETLDEYWMKEFATQPHARHILDSILVLGPDTKVKMIHDWLVPNVDEIVEVRETRELLFRCLELGDAAFRTSVISPVLYKQYTDIHKPYFPDDIIEHESVQHGGLLESAKDINRSALVEKCFIYANPEERRTMMSFFHIWIMELSLNNFGCQLLSSCFKIMEDEERYALIDELISPTNKWNIEARDAFLQSKGLDNFKSDKSPSITALASDRFGNYIINELISQGSLQHREEVIYNVSTRVLELLQLKFGSYSVEECFLAASNDQKKFMIDEMVHPTKANRDFLKRVLRADKFQGEEYPGLRLIFKQRHGSRVIRSILDSGDTTLLPFIKALLADSKYGLSRDEFGAKLCVDISL